MKHKVLIILTVILLLAYSIITEGNLINYLGNSIIISSEDFCNLFEISKESWIATGYHDSFISNEDIQSWIETE